MKHANANLNSSSSKRSKFAELVREYHMEFKRFSQSNSGKFHFLRNESFSQDMAQKTGGSFDDVEQFWFIIKHFKGDLLEWLGEAKVTKMFFAMIQPELRKVIRGMEAQKFSEDEIRAEVEVRIRQRWQEHKADRLIKVEPHQVRVYSPQNCDQWLLSKGNGKTIKRPRKGSFRNPVPPARNRISKVDTRLRQMSNQLPALQPAGM